MLAAPLPAWNGGPRGLGSRRELESGGLAEVASPDHTSRPPSLNPEGHRLPPALHHILPSFLHTDSYSLRSLLHSSSQRPCQPPWLPHPWFLSFKALLTLCNHLFTFHSHIPPSQQDTKGGGTSMFFPTTESLKPSLGQGHRTRSIHLLAA